MVCVCVSTLCRGVRRACAANKRGLLCWGVRRECAANKRGLRECGCRTQKFEWLYTASFANRGPESSRTAWDAAWAVPSDFPREGWAKGAAVGAVVVAAALGSRPIHDRGWPRRVPWRRPGCFGSCRSDRAASSCRGGGVPRGVQGGRGGDAAKAAARLQAQRTRIARAIERAGEDEEALMTAHDDAARSLKLAGCDEPSVVPERLEHLRAMHKLRPEDARTVGWRADLVLLLLDEGEVPFRHLLHLGIPPQSAASAIAECCSAGWRGAGAARIVGRRGVRGRAARVLTGAHRDGRAGGRGGGVLAGRNAGGAARGGRVQSLRRAFPRAAGLLRPRDRSDRPPAAGATPASNFSVKKDLKSWILLCSRNSQPATRARAC